MTLLNCRECRAEISDSVKKCPQCGVKRPGAEMVDCRSCGQRVLKDAEACPECFKSRPGFTDTERYSELIVLAVFLLLVISGVAWWSSQPIEPMTHSATHAVAQCNDEMRASLVSPSTARFPVLDAQAEHLGDGLYNVNSYVDSQNRFGATIRTHFTCTAQWVVRDAWSLTVATN